MPLSEQQDLPMASPTEPLLAVLCKSVIEVAYQHAEHGIPGASFREAFLRSGISPVRFELFMESMVRANLVVRGANGNLYPTTRGLAYAGIRPESRPRTLLASA